jgi:hypothetical protein
VPVAVLRSKFSEISKKFLDIMAANTDGIHITFAISLFV